MLSGSNLLDCFVTRFKIFVLNIRDNFVRFDWTIFVFVPLFSFLWLSIVGGENGCKVVRKPLLVEIEQRHGFLVCLVW